MLHWTVLQMVLQAVKTELNANSQLKDYSVFSECPISISKVRSTS